MELLSYFLRSIPKHIRSIGLRGLLNKPFHNGSFENGLFEIIPSNPYSLTHMKVITSESVFRFEQLTDLWAVDYPKHFKGHRFQVNYIMTSFLFSTRVRFYLFAHPLHGIPTLTDFIITLTGRKRGLESLWCYFVGHLIYVIF